MTKNKPHPPKKPGMTILKALSVIVAAAIVASALTYCIEWPEITNPSLPGELVDKAMAMPGAIVLSPHREVRELLGVKGYTHLTPYGILAEEVPEYLCSPAIAVHIGKRWCLWELGKACEFNPKEAVEYPMTLEVVVSKNGYRESYHEFSDCITRAKSNNQ